LVIVVIAIAVVTVPLKDSAGSVCSQRKRGCKTKSQFQGVGVFGAI
jgi:hypothetical protein